MSAAAGPVVLLDRDGVLNVDRPAGVHGLDELALEAGAAEGVALLARAGFTCLVVTNQALVGRGELSAAGLEAIHAELARRVAAGGGRIAAWYACTHRAEDGCACRKPLPGLLERAQREWGFAPARTWFVGDAERDVAAARAAGCRPALVATGKGAASARALPEVPLFPDLPAFARALIGAALETPA